MTQDLYYYESGYIDESYFVYTADTESSANSQFSQSCLADKLRSASATLDVYSAQVASAEVIMTGGTIEASASFGSFNSVIANVNKTASGDITLTSSFTQTVTVSYLYGADLFAFGEAQLQSQVDRIRDNNTQANSYFDIATGYIRYRSQSVEANDAFLFSSQEQRIRASQVETQGAFFIDVTAGKIKQASANITSQTSLEITTSGSVSASANLQSTASLEVSIAVTRVIECYADDYFTQDTQVQATKVSSSDLTVSASANAIAVKTTEVVSQHNSQYTLTSSAEANFSPTVGLTATSDVYVIASSNRSADLVSYSFASLSVTANSDFVATASLTTQSTVVADNTRVKLFKTNRPYADDNYVDPGYATEVSGVNSQATLIAVGETFNYVRGFGTLTSLTEQTTVANYNVTSLTASIESQATITATASRTQPGSANINAAFSPELTVDIFRNSFAVLDSVASIDITPSKFTSYTAQADSEFNTAVIGGVERQYQAAPTFTIGLDATGDLVAGAFADISAEATAEATALRIQSSSIDITSQTTTSAQILRKYSLEVSIASTFVLSVNVSPIRDSIELLVSSGDLTADVNAVRNAVVTTDAVFSELVLATTQTIQPQINLYVTSTLTATPVSTQSGITLEVSESTLAVDANLIKSTAVAASSQANVTATVKRIAKARATLQVTSTLTCQAQKQAEIAIVVSGFASLTAVGETARLAVALVGSQATLDITVKRYRGNQAAITAVVTETAAITYNVRPVIALNTQATLTAQIGAIHIDPYLTWTIPFEDRAYDIRQETNTYTIGRDNRIHTVYKDKREYTVRDETRIYTIRR